MWALKCFVTKIWPETTVITSLSENLWLQSTQCAPTIRTWIQCFTERMKSFIAVLSYSKLRTLQMDFWISKWILDFVFESLVFCYSEDTAKIYSWTINEPPTFLSALMLTEYNVTGTSPLRSAYCVFVDCHTYSYMRHTACSLIVTRGPSRKKSRTPSAEIQTEIQKSTLKSRNPEIHSEIIVCV